MAEKNQAVEIDEVVAETAATPKQRFNFNNLNTLSVVSLATSVTGFGALAGIITGHIALSQIKDSKQAGRPLALAGVIVGYSFIGLGVVATIARAFIGPKYGFEPMGFNGLMPGNPEHMPQFGNDDMGGMMGGEHGERGGHGHMGDMDGHGGMFRIDPTDPNNPVDPNSVDPNATPEAPAPTN
jgi:hypothetical protein